MAEPSNSNPQPVQTQDEASPKAEEKTPPAFTEDQQRMIDEIISKRVGEVKDGYQWYAFRPTTLTPKHMFSFGSGPWERGGGIGATKEVRLDCVEISRVAP